MSSQSGKERTHLLERIAAEDPELAEQLSLRVANATVDTELPDTLTLTMNIGLPERFRVIRCLGQGGFGTVYQVHDRELGHEVALKILRDPDPDTLFRFKQEFRSLATLRHPHLIEFYELFEYRHLWFFTMELVCGSSFLRHIRSGPQCDLGRLRNALRDLSSALAYLHANKLVHRDIKPGLLIGAGLMIRTFQALRQVHPGFTAPAQLQTFRIDIAEGQVKEPERAFRMQQEIRRKIAEIPGVSSVSFGNSVPTDGNNSTDVLYAEDHVYAEGRVPPLRRFKFVTPGFFQTMGTRLIAGRDLTWTDLEQRKTVAIVSENMARELWRDPAAAIGKRIREGSKDEWREIVGVAGDVRHDGADQKAPTTVYWPVVMDNFWGNEKFIQRGSVYVIRTDRTGSESLLTQVRQVV